MKKTGVVVFISLLVAPFLTGCNAGKNQTNIELVQAMMDMESIKAQDWDPKNPGKPAMLIPPENTVPIGKPPYAYKGDPNGAEKNLKNPLAGNSSPETISRGKKYYEIYCKVCHGASGKGDGLVAEKMMLKPVNLTGDLVQKLNDARIYHTITDGKGLMGSYANQIHDSMDRWAVVNYVRNLQGK